MGVHIGRCKNKHCTSISMELRIHKCQCVADKIVGGWYLTNITDQFLHLKVYLNPTQTEAKTWFCSEQVSERCFHHA